MGGNLLLSLWTASRASICMATMPVGHELGSANICTHTELVQRYACMYTRSYEHSVYLKILRPFNVSGDQLKGFCCRLCELRKHTGEGPAAQSCRTVNPVSAVPGIMLCRLLMWSWVTPLSVHTLSMKRATNLTTELATSLFSESSNPLSVSKLSATLPAMLWNYGNEKREMSREECCAWRGDATNSYWIQKGPLWENKKNFLVRAKKGRQLPHQRNPWLQRLSCYWK